MSNDINNFIKWLALKAFIINKVSNAPKIAKFFVFFCKSYFPLGHWVCSSDKMIPMYFLNLSEIRSIITSVVTGVTSEKVLHNAFLYFLVIFFVVLHYKSFFVIIFISFLDVVSNFCNRILTNQKQELVVSNWWWNCMHFYFKYILKNH